MPSKKQKRTVVTRASHVVTHRTTKNAIKKTKKNGRHQDKNAIIYLNKQIQDYKLVDQVE